MPKSEKLFEQAKKKIPGGVNSPVRAFQPYPFFTEYAKGSHIVDVDGNDYVDYCMGYGPLILGHAQPQIVKAVRDQLEKGTLYGTPTEQEVKLAELICGLVPSAEMVRLVNTGTEATMSAIRAARGFTGRKKIVKFEGCYHGAHDCVLVKAGSGATTFGMPNSLGIPEEATQNTLVVPYNDVEKFKEIVRAEKKNLAAVIVEPVLGNIGVVPPKEGFLETLRELTEKYSAVLIFDEVITGFRLSLGGAQEYYGIKPDMTTLGKILGAGFPMAAYCGREDIMRMIAPSGKVYQAGTFSGNPVSVSASLAILNLLRKKGTGFYSEMENKCMSIVNPLRAVLDELDLKLQINHVASMFQMFFTEHPVYDYATVKTADGTRFMEFHKKLLDLGVFLPPSQFETCFLSEAHTNSDIRRTVESFRSALSA
ncbi:MAG TPA: glutamate-1-semialdehyde 2,1-aminomutase [Candidatus Bathyarchaeia archaeon]|jgi:glutamate-1-semialdehyde 2,1-aminomutase|nr:glutamate-1-semialdehyde 2,1-aminomutase [Candidatus Bathyarchaeia archaeon]